MSLDTNLKNQIKEYFELLESEVIFSLDVDESQDSVKMKEFLEEVVSLSNKLSIREAQLERTPSFRLDAQDKVGNIVFSMIPLGHELSTFILATLQVSGRTPKVDQHVIDQIKKIDQPLKFQSYISLSCHICPDVVQAINIMAVINDNVSHTIIDGGIYREEVETLGIMAVPTVMLDGDEFSAGRTSLEEMLEKLVKTDQKVHYEKPFDVLVVGGGPAGASSAIYASRKGLNVGVITDRIGGQVLDTFAIENLIGTPYTEGPKLASHLHNHMREYDIEIINNKCVDKIVKGDLFTVELASGETIESKSVIIATGARWRDIGVPGEKEFKNKGVAYCSHCDGPMFKDKHVAVVGGGNSGIEAALDLANIAKHVTVFEFLPKLNADEVLQERIKKLGNTTIITNAQTTEILGDNQVNGVKYIDRETQKEHTLEIDGIFIQIGLVPNTEFMGDMVEKTRMGEIIVDDKGMTSIPGLFAAGDCTDSTYKQIIISMGSGATAALSAAEYVIEKN